MLDRNSLTIFYYFLLVFVILEIISPKFIINPISNFPYSAGRMGFIILGIIGLKKEIIDYDISVFFVGFIIIGFLVGSLYSVNVSKSIQISLGTGLLYIASIGFGRILLANSTTRLFDVLFIITFLYWANYIYGPINAGEIDLSIDFNSTLQTTVMYNRHIIGLPLTMSSIYLVIRIIEYGAKGIKIYFSYILSFVIIFITTFLTFMIHSRSNLLFYFIVLGMYFLNITGKINIKRVAFGFSFLFIIYFYLYNSIFDYNDMVSQRFFIGTTAYTIESTQTRFQLYGNFFGHFFQQPLGIGLFEPYIDLGYIRALMHNQYLSFIVSAGILGIPAVFILFKIIFKTLFKKKIKKNNIQRLFSKEGWAIFVPLKYSMILFFFTLTTVESGGLLFLFMLSLLFELHRKIYLSHKI